MPRSSTKNNSTANLGFEAKLWLAADKLRLYSAASRRVIGFSVLGVSKFQKDHPLEAELAPGN